MASQRAQDGSMVRLPSMESMSRGQHDEEGHWRGAHGVGHAPAAVGGGWSGREAEAERTQEMDRFDGGGVGEA